MLERAAVTTPFDDAGHEGNAASSKQPARPSLDWLDVQGIASARFEHDTANVELTLIERLNERTVSIRWHDATGCHYGEQPWEKKIARSRGVCLVSGKTITRGDWVYSPSTRSSTRPANADAMISAAELDEMSEAADPAV
ncbi:DUF3331 domain-containing protein [Paraburkholderia sp.]|uniref:DUF3331 domain-containing protein n=1 Tax=Paraburkholderia sp. TaxID=1926495 RepID=UPI00238DE8BD|nr:DUF3331 domain-containing protein [Paraburkholderia sp.]MDE1178993.1 DUF3331 domain-containing protein [Paraburkholderia sp.]